MPPVTIVGMAAGSILILTTAAVFWSKKAFPVGGIALCVVAFALIGMSQWSNIKLEAGGASIEVAREEIRQIANTVNEVVVQAEQAAAAVEVTKQQLSSVVDILENQQVLSGPSSRPIRRQLKDAPSVDISKLSKARNDLQKVIER